MSTQTLEEVWEREAQEAAALFNLLPLLGLVIIINWMPSIFFLLMNFLSQLPMRLRL